MPASMRSHQFATTRLSLGAFGGDDTADDQNQMGAAHPVHQGTVDVTPLMTSTLGTVAQTTAWRQHRGGSLPQPYTKRNAGSVFSFTE